MYLVLEEVNNMKGIILLSQIKLFEITNDHFWSLKSYYQLTQCFENLWLVQSMNLPDSENDLP